MATSKFARCDINEAATQTVQNFKAAQYKAWCKHYGDHKTGSKSHYSWNKDLLENVEDDTFDDFQRFDKEIQDKGQICGEALGTLLDSISTEMKGISMGIQSKLLLTALTEVRGVSFRVITPFVATFASKKKCLESILMDTSAKLEMV